MKLEINVPSSLNEITLGQYQEFLDIADKNPEGTFLQSKMISIFCGIPLADAYKLKVNSINEIVTILTDMLSVTPTHVERFKIEGIEYGFIPDLNDMSLGEYIDLDSNVGDWNNMHKAMSVLYRPVKNSLGDKYNIADYSVVDADRMKQTPLGAALGSMVFFWTLGKELSRDMIRSSEEVQGVEVLQEMITLTENGDGTVVSLDYHLETLRRLMQ
tara:strand:- start:1243 stop:1887 length:645 start_codon:yes stop_codon:yes gene_type:complete